jgi:hypothetical protein
VFLARRRGENKGNPQTPEVGSLIDSLEQATDSLGELAAQLKKTVTRVERKRKRSHTLRNALLAAGATAVLAAAALATLRLRHKDRPRVEPDAEVATPVEATPATAP